MTTKIDEVIDKWADGTLAPFRLESLKKVIADNFIPRAVVKEKIEYRIKDLKKRKRKVLVDTSAYAMQMVIEELKSVVRELLGERGELKDDD